MTGEGRTTHDRDADVAAYALGALEPAEAAQFEFHMRDCRHCRDELAAYQAVTDALPMAARQHAVPPGLRRRVTRAVRADARPRWRGRRSGVWHWSLGPRMAIAAACAVVVVGLAAAGVTFVSGGSRGSRVIDAQVLRTPGTAHVRLTGGRGQLVVNRMPQPAAGHIYEVWLQRPGHAPSPTHALFSVTAGGAADVDVPGDLSHVSRILVTQEPAGGSLVSTHPPLIVAQLT
jgi:anti-sigma-K factor RskA